MKMSNSEDRSFPHYNVVLLGRTGAGKSATGNTLLNKKEFTSKKSLKAVTTKIEHQSVTFPDVTLTVYDTPGLFDPEVTQEDVIKECRGILSLDNFAPTVILLVMKTDRFTTEEKKTVELIEDFLPEWLLHNTWILFTRGDELEDENQTIEKFFQDEEELKAVLGRFQNRYHVFNNKKQDPQQRIKLIEKIKSAELNEQPTPTPLPQTQGPAEDDPHERRILLLGKTGVGKSATGNTILGQMKFKSERSFSAITKACEMHETVIAGKTVRVVDTPGFFDSKAKPKDLAKQIGKSVYECRAGLHAFLYVVSLSQRFTQEDEKVIQQIESIYGKDVAKYTIPVFTHSDQLEGKSVDELIRQNLSLSKFVEQCGGRYHVFNNADLRNRKQVSELLKKIDTMVENNEGSCYCNKMYEAARSSSWSQFINFFKEHFWGAAIGLIVGGIGCCIGCGIGCAIGCAIGCGIGCGIGAAAILLGLFIRGGAVAPVNITKGADTVKSKFEEAKSWFSRAQMCRTPML